VGIRETVTEAKELIGFIAAVEMQISIYGHQIDKCVEIHSLCLRPDYRSRRLTPLLIKEIGRRCALEGGVMQAIFTTTAKMPFPPVAVCRDFYRLLNPVKLVECGFVSEAPFETIAEMVYRANTSLRDITYNIEKNRDSASSLSSPSSTSSSFSKISLRPMTAQDLDSVARLLRQYLSTNFALYRKFDKLDDVALRLLPRGDYLYTFVVEDHSQSDSSSQEEAPQKDISDQKGEIVAMASFYIMTANASSRRRSGSGSTTGEANQKMRQLKAAVLNYCVALKDEMWPSLIGKLLLEIAKEQVQCDLCIALNNLDRECSFFESLEFQIVPGASEDIYFNLYNWKCPPMQAKDVGILFW
jgi:glycylpeptide N-tetradecanoyltransferase